MMEIGFQQGFDFTIGALFALAAVVGAIAAAGMLCLSIIWLYKIIAFEVNLHRERAELRAKK